VWMRDPCRVRVKKTQRSICEGVESVETLRGCLKRGGYDEKGIF